MEGETVKLLNLIREHDPICSGSYSKSRRQVPVPAGRTRAELGQTCGILWRPQPVKDFSIWNWVFMGTKWAYTPIVMIWVGGFILVELWDDDPSWWIGGLQTAHCGRWVFAKETLQYAWGIPYFRTRLFFFVRGVLIWRPFLKGTPTCARRKGDPAHPHLKAIAGDRQ